MLGSDVTLRMLAPESRHVGFARFASSMCRTFVRGDEILAENEAALVGEHEVAKGVVGIE